MGRLTKSAGICVLAAFCCMCAVAVPMFCEAGEQTSGLTGTVNVNTATQKELVLLPGVGKKTADNIIAYRQQNGNFKTVEDLLKVKGFGKKTLAGCVDYMVLEGESTLKKAKK